MVLSYLEEIANKSKEIVERELPQWASSCKTSELAYSNVNKLRVQREQYIDNHFKASDYKKKSLFQISGSEIAEAIGVHRTTLMNTSSYSDEFRRFLCATNEALSNRKEEVLSASKKRISTMPSRRRRDELIDLNKKQALRIKELEDQNIEKIITGIFDSLSLPMKRKLGID